MKMGIHKFKTTKGNTLIVDIGKNITYAHLEDRDGHWLANYGSISVPKLGEQDGQTIITFNEFDPQRLRRIAVRPVITFTLE